jgi:hypothetical protein
MDVDEEEEQPMDKDADEEEEMYSPNDEDEDDDNSFDHNDTMSEDGVLGEDEVEFNLQDDIYGPSIQRGTQRICHFRFQLQVGAHYRRMEIV